jgi:histone-lysine N-methyltransferase SETMAR
LHENAHPHTANQTGETVNELGYELMEHPPYSPDLAPSGSNMFGSVKEALRGMKFLSAEEVIGEVQDCLKTQPKTLFFTELKNL